MIDICSAGLITLHRAPINPLIHNKMETKTKDFVRGAISQIEGTFKKDDIQSAPRKVLEDLILSLYDQLNEVNGTLPDWWERD